MYGNFGFHKQSFAIALFTVSRNFMMTDFGSLAPVTAVPETIILAPACNTRMLSTE